MTQEKPKIRITRKVRLWLYGIATATATVLLVYGIITIEQGGAWLALIAALLGTPSLVALDNVPEVDSH